eukprot:6486013-Amphidinium_carterae.1
MSEIYELMASPWWKMVQQHSAVHAHSRSQKSDFDEVELMYFHTTSTNFQQCYGGGNLGARFLFKSAGQAMLHRIIHHHFGLSGADLRTETFIVQCKVNSEWIATEGSECIN